MCSTPTGAECLVSGTEISTWDGLILSPDWPGWKETLELLRRSGIAMPSRSGPAV